MEKKLIPFLILFALTLSFSAFSQENKDAKGEDLLKVLEDTKKELTTASPAEPVKKEAPKEEAKPATDVKEKEEATPPPPHATPAPAPKEIEKPKAELEKPKQKAEKPKTEIAKASLLSPAIYGQTGLFRVYSAERQPSSATTFSLSMHGEWFNEKNFIEVGDDVSRIMGTGALTYTPLDFMEIYAALYGFTNTGKASTSLLQKIGDLRTGVKFGFDLSRAVSIGTSFGAEILNGAGDINVTGNAYNYDLRALLTFDFLKASDVPFRMHFNAGYRWDGTSKAAGILGITRMDQFFLNVLPKNQITFGTGFEIPIDFVSLFVEYSSEQIWGVSYGNNPQRITTGIKLYPTKAEDLTLDFGVDIGMLNSNKAARVIGVPGYNLIFGMTISKLPQETRAPVVLATAGKLKGEVVDLENQKPVGGALISFDDGIHNTILAKNETGEYLTGDLPPGAQKVTVSKEGFDPLSISTVVSAGQTSGVDFVLAKKKLEKGSIIFFISDADDKPLAGSIAFLDYPNLKPYQVDSAKGGLKVKLKAGNYKVKISADKFLSEEKIVSVEPGKEISEKIRLREIVSKVEIVKDKIVIKDKIHFASAKAEILTDSLSLLNRVADLIQDHKEIKKVRIEGYTDSVGLPEFNLKLSDQRAGAVKEYLMVRGIEPERVESMGYGKANPIAPNSTKQGRAINRRVEFTIIGD